MPPLDTPVPAVDLRVMELLDYAVTEALADWLDLLDCNDHADLLRSHHGSDDVLALAEDLVTVALQMRRKLTDCPMPLTDRATDLGTSSNWLSLLQRELVKNFGLRTATLVPTSSRWVSGSLEVVLFRLVDETATGLSGTTEGMLARLVADGVPLQRARDTVAVATA